MSFQLIQDCGALGQNAHLVETSVGEGFYTEDSSVITLSQLTMGYHVLASDFRRLNDTPDIFVQVSQITYP